MNYLPPMKSYQHIPPRPALELPLWIYNESWGFAEMREWLEDRELLGEDVATAFMHDRIQSSSVEFGLLTKR